MNFNASRNVSQLGGPRKAKRVSDVSAMGTPSPAPAFSPSPGYNAGMAPAGPPPPYSEGIQLEPQEYGSPIPQPAGVSFGYGGGFPQSPMASPAQIGSMLQQPIVQDMAFQYTNQLATQGREAVQREIGKYIPVSRLRYYFAVDTRYVIRKLFLIVFPFTHKTSHGMVTVTAGEFARFSYIIYYCVLCCIMNNGAKLFEQDWMVKYDQETPVQPRYDINAPDLYIPSMGYVSYVLLAGFMLGLQHRFSPEQISIQASSALAYIIFEMVLYLVTLYVTNTGTQLKTLDLLAYSGYKYTAMIGSLLGGLVLGRTGYYSCLFYYSCALSYFLVKTLRLQLLSGGAAAEAAPPPYAGYGAPPPPETNPYSQAWARPSAGGIKRRLYFLLFAAVTQPLLCWWLTCHLVPAHVAPPPAATLS